MKTLGNIIWFIFGGIEWCLTLLITSLLFFISIVGIPVGIQVMKMATFVLWPFGKKVIDAKPKNILYKVMNIIWAILFGWIFALGFFITGFFFCITLIGIPFGKQYFKLAHFVVFPLGHEFE